MPPIKVIFALLMVLPANSNEEVKIDASIKLVELKVTNAKWLANACKVADATEICSMGLQFCICSSTATLCHSCHNFRTVLRNISAITNRNLVQTFSNDSTATFSFACNEFVFMAQAALLIKSPNNNNFTSTFSAVQGFNATTASGLESTTIVFASKTWSCTVAINLQYVDGETSQEQKTSVGVRVVAGLGTSFCLILIIAICWRSRKSATTTPATILRKALVDLAPVQTPRIPVALVDLVREIEQRGLGSVGLYRLSGFEPEVNRLLQHFAIGTGAPNLGMVSDINVLACCVKKFLRQLSEPLIPPTSWHQFAQAVDFSDSDLLHQAIRALPSPNRHTLAFLISHLQKVAKNSAENKMTIKNLAKIFGPTIVGYSSQVVTLEQGIEETKQQEAIVQSFLAMTLDYWNCCLADNDSQ